MNYRNKYDEIDPEIVKIVRSVARRAIGKAGLTLSDLPDIEQDLMLTALSALKRLQKDAEYEKAFVSRCVKNKLKSILRKRHCKSKKWFRCCVSLNLAVELDDGGMEELINLIDTDHLLCNNSCFCADPYRDIDLAGNINSLIKKLPKNLQELCHELKNKSVLELAREKKMTRKLLSWKMRELRKELEKLELFARANPCTDIALFSLR